MSHDVEEQYDKQRRQQYHAGNLQGGQERKGEAAEILSALSNVDDLPIDPESDPVMGQLVSRLTSTANLSAQQVRSNEWIREYILVLYLCQFPREDGAHGPWRGIAHGSVDAERDPLDPQTRMQLEAFVSMSKLALSRSEDAKVIEEGTRDVSESIVNEGDGDGGGSGILGKLG
jgi:hypothetical protein